MDALSINRTYVLLIYDPGGRDYAKQDIRDACHEEAIATARALAMDGRADLWLGNSKVGLFPRAPSVREQAGAD